eukprot:TRINITY_DN32269_c0_g1_i3.p1 TRINITY_DN32269_c0_g1~~TRINITY_DN32269_c0_g1_i3.p1  ORF type:complete len:358 (+),score=36.35 TRINITY_DN32269_c0_g1_i3:208-1281(+)
MSPPTILSRFVKGTQRRGSPTWGNRSAEKMLSCFPFFGSASLLSLYVAYKFLSPYWVNVLLSVYLAILGSVATCGILSPLLAKFLFFVPKSFGGKQHEIRFQLPWLLEKKDGPYEIDFNGMDIIAFVVAAIISLSWAVTNHWCLHNILAVCFSIQMISMISLCNFKVALILLSGLFFYDIFWVFGTDVMVTVAKSFEGPVKVIFPLSFQPWKQSILGLGDIVIPGMFISMCLRLDHTLDCKAKDKPVEAEKIDIHTSFRKDFFHVNLVAYAAGLMLTALVMLAFKAAQPALLYLVPACTLGYLGTTFVKKNWEASWGYSEAEVAEKPDDGTTTAEPQPTDEIREPEKEEVFVDKKRV